ncbi:hypothetical protein [Candidatus Rhodobacter oscarellae]|nr:hypothetical protein [Candidatus Rhodobacter lobularis]
MKRAATLWAAILMLSACGVDAPPVPPGEENPENIRSIDEIDPSAYF